MVDRVRRIEAEREKAMAAAAAPFDAELEKLYAQLDKVGASLGQPVVIPLVNGVAVANGHAAYGRGPHDDYDDDERDPDSDAVDGDGDDLGFGGIDEDSSKTDIVIAAIRRGGPLDYAMLAAKMYPDEDQAHARKKLRSLMSSLKHQDRIKFIGNKGDKLWEVVR